MNRRNEAPTLIDTPLSSIVIAFQRGVWVEVLSDMRWKPELGMYDDFRYDSCTDLNLER